MCRLFFLLSLVYLFISLPSTTSISLSHLIRTRGRSHTKPGCSGFVGLFMDCDDGAGGGNKQPTHTTTMKDGIAKAPMRAYNNPFKYCSLSNKDCEHSILVTFGKQFRCKLVDNKCVIINPPYNAKGDSFNQKIVDQCKKIKRCEDIRGTRCGWCGKQGYARPGFTNVPVTEDQCDDWNYDSLKCDFKIPAQIIQQCKNIKTCPEIKGTPCGWCKKQGYARPGKWAYPTTPDQCDDWNFDSLMCKEVGQDPVLINQCAGITTCKGIAGTNCGWCGKQGYARPGSYGQPNTKDKCDDWTFDSGTCKVEPAVIEQCKSITTCAGIKGTECGWCKKQGYARPGGWGKPNTPDKCDDWTFDSAQCDIQVADKPEFKSVKEQCKSITTCAGIKGTPCGWCKKQGYARPGDWNKPDTKDKCDGWNYDSAAC